LSVARQALRAARSWAACLPWRGLAAMRLYRPALPPVAFVAENADWVIRRLGERICAEIERLDPGTAAVTTRPERLFGRIVHFGSQYMWVSWGAAMGTSNRYVTSFFHGKPEDGAEVARHIDAFLASVPRLDKIVTAAGIVEKRLLDWGVPRDKLVRIPIGVDTECFAAPDAARRQAARAAFGIGEGQVAVGSFQKDGVGWGDGLEPKLIKGPDIFLEVVDRLRREIPLFVLLTGPARGYVKRGLERLGVSHAHTYVDRHEDLVPCYHALDLYFVTSREEGGPMGLMEAMASGVPVVSTAVGMAPDLIVDGLTGGLAQSEDVEGLCRASLDILNADDGGRAMREAAREAVKVCDWRIVGRDHLEKVYRPLS
jgi:glycosyltransferase involved in cell wall biosynthesis